MRRTSPALVGLLIAGFVLMLALNWPGQLSFDSVTQLHDGRSGFYNSWHPPVMAFLLGLFDGIIPGTGLFILFNGALALFALIAFASFGSHTRWSLAVALLILLTPQWLLYQGTVWKDLLFADAALAGFAALALATMRWQRGWLGLSILLLALAAMARQNGIVILPFAAGALGLVAVRQMPRLKALGAAIAFFAATLALAVAGNIALATHGDGGAGLEAELHIAQAYDLAGMVRRDPALPLARLATGDPDLERILRHEGVKLYTPAKVDPFMNAPVINQALSDAPDGLLFAQWRDSLLSRPGLYLAERMPVFLWALATPEILICHPVYAGVEGPATLLTVLGLAPGLRPQDRLLKAYGFGLVHTPVFSHLAFGALALGLLVWLARRGRDADVIVAGLLAAALAFAASFFLVSLACDYRYLYFLDFAAMAAALYAAMGQRGKN